MIAATSLQGGGATWAVLQYLLGLRRLGCGVRFMPRVRAAIDQCAVALRSFADLAGMQMGGTTS
jgi:hypothetical protein